jgi:hypothetical protein
MVVLQNCMALLNVGPHLYNETCPASSRVGNQVTSIKVENDTYMQEDEDPISTTLPVIKMEHEVSCMSVFLISICLSIHIKQLHCGEWILKVSYKVSYDVCISLRTVKYRFHFVVSCVRHMKLNVE